MIEFQKGEPVLKSRDVVESGSEEVTSTPKLTMLTSVIPVEQVLSIAETPAETIHYAHTKGIFT